MSLIAIKDLSLTRSEPLFTGLSFSIAKGDRLGLVAANGRGKSSLLRIMAGEEEATTGAVVRVRGLVVAFAPQDPPERLMPLSLGDAVRDALTGEVAETESWRVDILLDDLAVDEAIRGRAVHSLSGGWQRTMLLAMARRACKSVVGNRRASRNGCKATMGKHLPFRDRLASRSAGPESDPSAIVPNDLS
jgi:ATPase subunit of ABC transporter with duplicated ATPase domains